MLEGLMGLIDILPIWAGFARQMQATESTQYADTQVGDQAITEPQPLGY